MMNQIQLFFSHVFLLGATLSAMIWGMSSCNIPNDPYDETVFMNAVHRQYHHFELIPNHAQLVSWSQTDHIAIRCQPSEKLVPIGLELINQKGKVVLQQHYPDIIPTGMIKAPLHKLKPGPYEMLVYFESGQMIKTWLTVP